MKILVTGGHLMPALSVIDFLTKDKKIEIIFVGRKYNLDSEESYSLEFQEVKRRRLKFIPFTAGRLKKEFSFSAIKNFFLIFVGLVYAVKIILSEKPDRILSFGSFLGFPFTFVGWLLKKPVFIHEQTLNPGFANQFGAFFAKKVFVSFPQAAKFFPQNKTIISGNPIRKEIFSIQTKPFSIEKNRPVIYVTGGSLGSHSLNEHLKKILPALLEKNIVIHQTGNVKQYDDYATFVALQKNLPAMLKKRYFLREHIYSDEIGYIYSLADLVISRSGANIFFELIALKKPAILVPLPWSSRQEQQKQAELFTSLGLGEVFSQFEKSEKLLDLINKMFSNLKSYQKSFNSLASFYKQNAAETIVRHILF